jgi:hypothetical protein
VPEADIEDVVRRHEADLLARPEVVGVGVGSRAGRPVVRVLVDPSSASSGDIPTTIEGYDVEVSGEGPFSAQA